MIDILYLQYILHYCKIKMLQKAYILRKMWYNMYVELKLSILTERIKMSRKNKVKIFRILVAIVAIAIIIGVIAYLYKPTYRVILNGEMIGYTENKGKLQNKINEYVKNGDGENVAYVQIDTMPEYQLCLLKKDIVANDEEIYNKVKEQGTPYYRYYAILDNQEEKFYVSNFTEAETVVNQLKEKNSTNIDTITIAEKYETELKDFTSTDEAVSKLYVEPVKTVEVAKTSSSKTTKTTKTSSRSVNTSTNISGGKASLGISLVKPVSGIITSRFAASSRIRSSAHTGLDIATSSGTPVVATASGKVTFSGWKGSYGKLLVITHSNGVQTYYGHCSALYASVGQTVSQGQTICAVGSTGNSTGPHLHFEIRVNGVAYNPQNYLY